jgi:protein phosphatase
MAQPEHGIRLRSSARTSTGQVRENNEDHIHLWARDQFVLAVVADGMGGAAAGEEASRIAVEAIKAGFNFREQPDIADISEEAAITERLRQSIQTANSSIMRKALAIPEMRGMGTTITLAHVRGTQVIVAHVGDSRAYLVDSDDGSITQITSDHSFVQALLMAGHITPEQAENHPMGNVLYRALGQAEDVDIDIYYRRLHVGDRLVLCSDGLTRHVRAEEIARLSLADPNPDGVSQALIDLANSRGGEDNVSVIVISVEGDRAAEIAPHNVQVRVSTDDDETLLLRERPITRAEATALADKEPNGTSSGTTDELKMHAERLKDSADHSDLFPSLPPERESAKTPAADDHDQAIPRKPDAPLEAIGQRTFSAEGRDTLTPDQ